MKLVTYCVKGFQMAYYVQDKDKVKVMKTKTKGFSTRVPRCRWPGCSQEESDAIMVMKTRHEADGIMLRSVQITCFWLFISHYYLSLSWMWPETDIIISKCSYAVGHLPGCGSVDFYLRSDSAGCMFVYCKQVSEKQFFIQL